MRAIIASLVRRREALVERSAAQRAAVAAAAAGVRSATALPLMLGLGVAAVLLGSSPRLRGWVVRAWAIYAFVSRLLPNR